MKEKIFSKIKEALGKTSLSERTLQTKSNVLAKTITSDELLTDDVIADVVEELKSYEGQLNHDIAEALKKQKKTKPEQNTEDSEEEQEEEDEDNGKKGGKSSKSKKEEGVMEEILKKLKALEDEIDAEKKNKAASSLKEQIIASLKGSGSTNELILKAAMYESGINFEESVEDNVKRIQEAYDKEASSFPATTQRPFFGDTGSVGKNEAEMEAERKERQAKILKDGRL